MRSRVNLAAGRLPAMFAIASVAFVGASLAAQPAAPLSSTIAPEAAGMWAGDGATLQLPSSTGGGLLEPIPLDAEASAGGNGINSSCAGCNGGTGGGMGYPFDRCGCNPQLFPWIEGPGACDNWCVGPHWNVEVEGMALRRSGADWDPILNNVPAAANLVDDFGYAPGARIFATAYNDSDFGLQIGYEGIDQFNATAGFTDIDPDPNVTSNRIFDYSSSLHSLEINVLRRSTLPLRVFAGFRYVQIGEDFVNLVDEEFQLPLVANDTFVDSQTAHLLENRLIGVQLGALRDAWALNRWLTLEPYANAGVYINDFKRTTARSATTTNVTIDDPTTPLVNEFSVQASSLTTSDTRNFSDIAFLGETGISAVIRISRCVALRGGYQVLAIDGVSEASSAFLNPGFDSSTVIYHGARFGFEYQR